MMMDHFDVNYSRDGERRYTMPLSMKAKRDLMGETTNVGLWPYTFLSMEQLLRSKEKLANFADVVDKYFWEHEGHAEPVPPEDLSKPRSEVFYLLMYVECNDTSIIISLHVVFDASAKPSTSVSLNDQLHVGPTVYAPLLDVLSAISAVLWVKCT